MKVYKYDESGHSKVDAATEEAVTKAWTVKRR